MPWWWMTPMYAADDGGSGGAPADDVDEVERPTGGAAPKVYSEEYVRALRAENAGYRTQRRELERQLQAIRSALGLKDEDVVSDWGRYFADRTAEHEGALAAAQETAKKLVLKAEVTAQAAALGIVDPDIAFAVADLSEAQVDDEGTVTGVKEALEALVEAKPFLKRSGGSPSIGAGTNPGDAGKTERNPWKTETFNLTEQGRILQENPALAERLKAEAKG